MIASRNSLALAGSIGVMSGTVGGGDARVVRRIEKFSYEFVAIDALGRSSRSIA